MHPKPTPRGPKARKRLTRSKPLRRSGAPARRRRPRPRKLGPLAEMRREAERLASMITIRMAAGRCEVPIHFMSLDDAGGLRLLEERCSRPATDAMHVLSKGSRPCVRYELSNLIAGCRMHHDELGSAKLAGPCAMQALFLRIRGRGAWEHLLALAAQPKKHLPDILAGLRTQAAKLGIR